MLQVTILEIFEAIEFERNFEKLSYYKLELSELY